MRLYFAGNVITEENEQFLVAVGVRHRLITFAEIDSWAAKTFAFWTSSQAPGPIFVDSGAFGALTRGATIDLKRYCEYIKANQQYTDPYAALDVIGNYRGSARNFDYMLAEGLKPVPAFHMGSPDHELRRLLGMTDYIALGGVVGAQENEMRPWLDCCFRTIKDFWPKKVHIFGVMAQWVLERYPAFSVDSSGAIVGGGMGRVTLFEDCRVTNYDWRKYAKLRYDGDVMDGISLSRSRGKTGSANMARRRINIQSQLALQRFITDVWTMRGITWEDQPCAASMAPSATSTGNS